MDGNHFDALARRMASGTSRRRLLKGIAGGLTALIGAGAATRSAQARTITICHATGNPAAPFQSLTIEQAEFNLHARHGDYLRVECCANTDCPNQYGSCGSGVCQSGYCVQLPVAAGTSCDDGLYCNGESVCDGAFSCVPGADVICPGTGNPCTTNVCDESVRGCIEVAANEGNGCGGDWCRPDICRSGVCTTEPVTCPASTNPCTRFRCDAAARRCVEESFNEGNSCGGDWCEPAICQSGACISEPVICPESTNPCAAARCDATTQSCVEEAANEGDRCGGSWCEPDVCRSGSCRAEPVTCLSTSDPCTTIRCDETAQGCIQVPKNEGSRCGGSPCEPAFCRSGSCSTEPIVCTPADQCHTSTCDAANGQCKTEGRVNEPCVTGNQQPGLCNSAGVCVATATCSDGIKNGSETDVDCGGGTCPPCANGKRCGIDADCASNRCSSGVCVEATPTCTDWIKNGAETDIDCGGGTCPPCEDGRACRIDSDCGSNHCVQGICIRCPTGQTVCGNICVDLRVDPDNCGACGHNCQLAPHARSMICDMGACKVRFCNDGYGDCDHVAANGCETPLIDVDNCGGCGNVCPGFQTPNANANCNDYRCGFTCQGEYYDADANFTNGCEVQSYPTGNHTQATALSVYSDRCNAGAPKLLSGVFPSDYWVHANPAVNGFDASTGSAPHWYVVPPGAPVSCNDNMGATLTMFGSDNPACYRLEASYGSAYFSAGTNAGGVATITAPGGMATNTSNVYFRISKTCDTNVTEAPAYFLQFHL